MLYTLAALVALAAAPPVPSQRPDSATRARYAPALHALEDSLGTLSAVVARFQTDLSNASRDLVVSRSTRLRERCTGALTAAAALDGAVPARASLRSALASLRSELSRCNDDFATGQWTERADSLRAWAPHRLARLTEAVQRYRWAARRYDETGSDVPRK